MSASVEVTVGKRRSQFTATSAVFQYLLGEYITLTNLQLVCNSEFSLRKVNLPPIILESKSTAMNTQTLDITASPFKKTVNMDYAADQFSAFQEPLLYSYVHSQKSLSPPST